MRFWLVFFFPLLSFLMLHKKCIIRSKMLKAWIIDNKVKINLLKNVIFMIIIFFSNRILLNYWNHKQNVLRDKWCCFYLRSMESAIYFVFLKKFTKWTISLVKKVSFNSFQNSVSFDMHIYPQKRGCCHSWVVFIPNHLPHESYVTKTTYLHGNRSKHFIP